MCFGGFEGPRHVQTKRRMWKDGQGEGVCCFILAGSGGIDAFRASRVLPHLLHLLLGKPF